MTKLKPRIFQTCPNSGGARRNHQIANDKSQISSKAQSLKIQTCPSNRSGVMRRRGKLRNQKQETSNSSVSQKSTRGSASCDGSHRPSSEFCRTRNAKPETRNLYLLIHEYRKSSCCCEGFSNISSFGSVLTFTSTTLPFSFFSFVFPGFTSRSTTAFTLSPSVRLSL